MDTGYAEDCIALAEPLPLPLDSALRLTGDGNFFDGIASREAFTLPRGGTPEFEIRLPLVDRTDRQRVLLCLSDGEEGPSEQNNGVNWVALEEVCLPYPFGELGIFDAASLYLYSTFLELGRTTIPDQPSRLPEPKCGRPPLSGTWWSRTACDIWGTRRNLAAAHHLCVRQPACETARPESARPRRSDLTFRQLPAWFSGRTRFPSPPAT